MDIRHAVLRLLFLITSCLTALWATGQSPVFTGVPLPPGHERLNTAEETALQGSFHRFEVFSMDLQGVHAVVTSATGTASLRLVLGGHDLDLTLEPHELRAPDMLLQVATDSGIERPAPVASSTYKGHLQGDPMQHVRFSVRSDALLGHLWLADGELVLEPMANIIGGPLDDRIVVYRAADIVVGNDSHCGVTHMERLEREVEVETKGGNACRLANLGLAADASMVTFLGSVTAVENRMLDILNWVDGKYQEPAINIAYQVVSIFISTATANDPWTSSQDAPTLLQSFRNWGNTGGFGAGVQFAVATLWTRRDIQSSGSSGTIGLAYVGVVCTTNRYNLCEHYTTAMTGPMIVQTHELGHNWNAPHTTTAGQWIMAPTASLNNTNWDSGSIGIIVAHKNSRTCLGNSCLLLPVVDFAATSTLSCDGTVAFTDLSANEPDSWLWNFGDGNTSTQQNPVHTYTNSGTYTVQLTATNSTGQGVQTRQDYVTVDLLPPPVTQGVELCFPGGVADLSASGSYTLQWFTTPTGGTPVHTGPVYGPTVSSTTTWYVADDATPPPAFGGATTNTIGPGGFFTANDNWGLRFDVGAPSTLVSVKVYANAAGTRTIQLVGSGGSVLDTRTVSIPAGESRVTLNIDLPVGQQHLLKLSGSTLGLYRNEAGGQFPYAVGGTITITETNATAQGAFGYYYYFYDWEVQEPGCISARTPVTAEVVICSGMNESVDQGGLSIAPNPSDGHFRLDWQGMHNASPAHLQVVNGLGQLVSTASVEGRQQLDLHIDGAPGVYILRLFDAEGLHLLDRRLLRH